MFVLSVNSTVMDYMSTFASSFNGSSAALSMGESITGVLVKQKDPLDVNEVSFAYTKPNDSFNVSAFAAGHIFFPQYT